MRRSPNSVRRGTSGTVVGSVAGRVVAIAIAISIAFGIVACQRAGEGEPVSASARSARSTPTVFTVNEPLAWMARRIGGDAIEVVFPVPEGVDPAHWQPSPEIVLEYQAADLVLLNGAGYADWIEYASLAAGRLVDTTGGSRALLVPAGDITHSHGPAGDHDHGDVASHTWLDPTLASRQAEAVADALIALLPERESALVLQLGVLQADLAQLDKELTEGFAGWQGVGVLYSHPVYQYLDAHFRLAGHSVTWEPGADPGTDEWRKLERRLAGQPAAVMFWEGEPLPSTVERLQQLGLEVVLFETGAGRSDEGDTLAIMRRNADRIGSFNMRVRGEHY